MVKERSLGFDDVFGDWGISGWGGSSQHPKTLTEPLTVAALPWRLSCGDIRISHLLIFRYSFSKWFCTRDVHAQFKAVTAVGKLVHVLPTCAVNPTCEPLMHSSSKVQRVGAPLNSGSIMKKNNVREDQSWMYTSIDLQRWDCLPAKGYGMMVPTLQVLFIIEGNLILRCGRPSSGHRHTYRFCHHGCNRCSVWWTPCWQDSISARCIFVIHCLDFKGPCFSKIGCNWFSMTSSIMHLSQVWNQWYAMIRLPHERGSQPWPL